MKTYRIYGYEKKRGWGIVETKTDKEKAIDFAKSLSAKDYYKYMIIEHDNEENSDFPIERGDLYEECKVTQVNDFKAGIKVKAMEIKPFNRAKNKQELKKITEQYIDR